MPPTNWWLFYFGVDGLFVFIEIKVEVLFFVLTQMRHQTNFKRYQDQHHNVIFCYLSFELIYYMC
jgi:hypothetical protein